jgi:hypothetical protein
MSCAPEPAGQWSTEPGFAGHGFVRRTSVCRTWVRWTSLCSPDICLPDLGLHNTDGVCQVEERSLARFATHRHPAFSPFCRPGSGNQVGRAPTPVRTQSLRQPHPVRGCRRTDSTRFPRGLHSRGNGVPPGTEFPQRSRPAEVKLLGASSQALPGHCTPPAAAKAASGSFCGPGSDGPRSAENPRKLEHPCLEPRSTAIHPQQAVGNPGIFP